MDNLPDPIEQPGFYASVPGKRLLAWVFDAVFVLILCIVVLPFTGFLALLIWPLWWLMFDFAYRTITIATGSATWGMRIMAIELRNTSGARLNLPEAALHTLGYTISIGSLLIQAVSMVLMSASFRGQSLSDHILGTVMINRRAKH
ncbi:MAG: putative RDD family membrane protein YckC [Ascidiaceihabitans sp.]|jgi:uncharacterized RDD family membrane protein YckC